MSNLSAKEDVFGIADKLIHSIALPFEIEAGAYHISVSIGISFYREHGADLDQLITCADQAMYVAKQQGKNKWVVYGDHQKVLSSDAVTTLDAMDNV